MHTYSPVPSIQNRPARPVAVALAGFAAAWTRSTAAATVGGSTRPVPLVPACSSAAVVADVNARIGARLDAQDLGVERRLLADIRAAVGPAIGQCCFETDSDVPEALRATLGAAAEPFMVWNGSKWHIDLKAINGLWLQKAGVTAIDVCGDCTACRPDLYWSHRKTGLQRGEQAALIALKEDTP